MNQTFFERVVNLFHYAGVSKEEYKSVKKEAYKSNFHLWKSLHVFVLLIFIGIYINCLINPEMSELYLGTHFMLAYSLISVLVFFFVFKEDSLIAQFWIYLSMILVLICGLKLSIAQPEMMGVTFIVLLVVLPMFMIDKPYYMTMVLIISDVIYMIFVSKAKNGMALSGDWVNIVVYSFLGIFVNVFYNSIRIKEFLLQKTIEKQRDTDDLTGLCNKNSLFRFINEQIEKSDEDCIMMVFDIDKLKQINDNYGHDVGDDVLEAVGKYLKKTIKPEDIAGRFGGDEFIVLLVGKNDIEKAKRLAQNMIDYVNSEVHTPNYNDRVEICIGIAVRDSRDRNFDTLFKKADIALYRAKESGRNTFAVY